jgi:hypothetical protein
MGYFKGRFCLLQGLRQQIDNSVNHECALAWVKVCIVIHTLVLLIEDGHEDAEFMEDLVQQGLADSEDRLAQGIVIGQEAAQVTRGQQK